MEAQGTATQPPDQPPQPRVLSCTNCRSRKVKCNKVFPCTPCQRSGDECVFPQRAKKRRKRQGTIRNNELQSRLDTLESMVSRMQGVPKDHLRISAPDTPEDSPGGRSISIAASVPTMLRGADSPASPDSLVASDFWRNLAHEVEGLRQILDEDGIDDDHDDLEISDQASANDNDASGQHSFLLMSHAAHSMDLQSMHPSPGQARVLMDLYLDRVDFIFKVLHRPTLKALFASYLDDPSTLSKSNEALLLAVFFSGITCITDEECAQYFARPKMDELAHYRIAAEKALANADYLNTTDMTTLQAFCIYLAVVRTYDNSRFCWTMTGLAVRIAHAFGIHRDGDGSSYTPFEAEMRRRLWWQIVALDLRGFSDRGHDPLILEGTFNTDMPNNIEDEDFDALSAHINSRNGMTSISTTLVRSEFSIIAKRLNYSSPDPQAQQYTIREKERMLIECHQKLEDRYLKYADPSTRIGFMEIGVVRLVTSELYLSIHYPLIRTDKAPARSDALRDCILETGLLVIQYDDLLGAHSKAHGIGWFHDTFAQWHALGVCLTELSVRTTGPLADKAWQIVDKAMDSTRVRIADSKTGALWRPLRKLYQKAQRARQQGLASEQGPASQDQYFNGYVAGGAGAPTTNADFPRLAGPLSHEIPRAAVFDDTRIVGHQNLTQPNFPGQDLHGHQDSWEAHLNSPLPFEMMGHAPDVGSLSLSMDAGSNIDWINWNAFMEDAQDIGVWSSQFLL